MPKLSGKARILRRRRAVPEVSLSIWRRVASPLPRNHIFPTTEYGWCTHHNRVC